MAESRFTNPLQALAYYTECAFATAEGARLKKSTPKREQARFDSLANGMFENLKLIIYQSPTYRANLRTHIERLSLGRLRAKFEAEPHKLLVPCPTCGFTDEQENCLTGIVNGVDYHRCNNCGASFGTP